MQSAVRHRATEVAVEGRKGATVFVLCFSDSSLRVWRLSYEPLACLTLTMRCMPQWVCFLACSWLTLASASRAYCRVISFAMP